VSTRKKRKKHEPTLGDAASEGGRLVLEGISRLGALTKEATQHRGWRTSRARYDEGQRAHEKYIRRSSTETALLPPPRPPVQGQAPAGQHLGNLGLLVAAIQEFQPARKYSSELPYQAELFASLKANHWSVEFERQRGHSRPDLVVLTIFAIEVKGPTTSGSLATIADKMLRYRQHFDHVICVLFDVQVNEGRYAEWLQGVMAQFPNVVVIRK